MDLKSINPLVRFGSPSLGSEIRGLFNETVKKYWSPPLWRKVLFAMWKFLESFDWMDAYGDIGRETKHEVVALLIFILLLPFILLFIYLYLTFTFPSRPVSRYVGQKMEISGVVTSCTRKIHERWGVNVASESGDITAICKEPYPIGENVIIKGECFEYAAGTRPQIFLKDCVVVGRGELQEPVNPSSLMNPSFDVSF